MGKKKDKLAEEEAAQNTHKIEIEALRKQLLHSELAQKKLESALGEQTKKALMLQADRDRLTATLAAANSKYADLYNDYQRGVKINATLEDKCNDLQEESANMSKELVAQREKYETLRAERNALVRSNESLQYGLEKRDKQLAELNEQLDTANRRMARLLGRSLLERIFNKEV